MDITLDKAIDGFKLSIEASGLADKTISWFDSNIKLFQKWLDNHLNNGKVKLEKISDVDLKKYLSELRNKDSCFMNHPYRPEENHSLSPRTIRGYYASLSAFFNWSVREEFLFTFPRDKIPKSRTPKYLIETFTKSHIAALLEICN